MAISTPQRILSLLLLLVLIAAVFCQSSGNHIPPREDIVTGRSLNIFRNYGSLVLTLRVTSHGGYHRGIIDEPTHGVFVKAHPARPVNKPREEELSGWELRMSFCGSVEEVMAEYFRHFRIEGLAEPWRAFTGSWERRDLARHLGIDEHYASGDHGYVFVSISKNMSRGKWYVKGLSVFHLFVITEEPVFNKKAENFSESIVPGKMEELNSFFQKYGTHYLSSYVTGDSLYQVFVYDQSLHRNFEAIMVNKGMSIVKLRVVSTLLSPWYAVHLGKIQTASGNATLTKWIYNNLEDRIMDQKHFNILKCFRNTDIRKRLEGVMSDEVLLRLELRSLGHSIRNPERRAWFEEVLRNRMNLWEANA